MAFFLTLRFPASPMCLAQLCVYSGHMHHAHSLTSPCRPTLHAAARVWRQYGPPKLLPGDGPVCVLAVRHHSQDGQAHAHGRRDQGTPRVCVTLFVSMLLALFEGIRVRAGQM